MYPLLDFGVFQIYTFGISITLCFFLFAWMLNRLSKRLKFTTEIFTDGMNILWIFLGTFFFSRLFYVISKWNDLKYIDNLKEFFIMTEYNFSLVGGIFGFLLIIFILLKIRKEKLDKYIYGLMLSFLFVLPIGFLGALLGGQVYGIDTNFGIEISYSHPLTPVPYKAAIFPLALIYAVIFFLTFSAFYILNMYTKQKALMGYLAFTVFAIIIFTLEFFSGKKGIFLNSIGINLSQIFSIIFAIFGGYNIYKIYKKDV